MRVRQIAANARQIASLPISKGCIDDISSGNSFPFDFSVTYSYQSLDFNDMCQMAQV